MGNGEEVKSMYGSISVYTIVMNFILVFITNYIKENLNNQLSSILKV